MTGTIRRGLAAAILAAGVACAAATADEKPKAEVVKEITDVAWEFEKGGKRVLVVTVTGQVPTGGWTDPRLTRRTYIKPPADGIYDYDLTAVRPAGAATQVISTVKTTHRWTDPPSDIKGIRVHGVADGVKTVKFDEKK
jgi:phenylpyruvate tautomerase PptA (4-oxalocrotonate tautomerase family)